LRGKHGGVETAGKKNQGFHELERDEIINTLLHRED